MPCAFDSIQLGEKHCRSDEGIYERQLVTDRGKAVKLNEGEREWTSPLPLAVHEHPVPRNEDVIENRQRLHHLVLAAYRVVKVVAFRSTVRARNQRDTGCVHWNCK